ncbi:EmrB/QacA subfamily drug resistance transporter [Silvimonas terrae]|uniref:EmrB/QacA subfamily drug resistance transporter n=1 Tax=Silvimonas terrae TaxID=300266 RepID=A0A840RI21_9NEIS|nr:MFS transporter [Silvimonas terrae]MBB5192975.1 EmrB/QacA subfamily drug resistance transporter [Silvimonas terrae]
MSRPFIIPLIVACALFMENMDATVISTSLPVLARDLGQNPITLKLALTAYVVGLGVFIPVCGWVADRFGARTVFRTAIGIFMAGSLLCAVSSTLPAFVGARFLQGMGGAMMVPVGRIIIFRAVPRSDLVKAIGYLTMPALFGPVIGPPLGGFITTYFHWRWIFLVNIPVSLLGLYLAGRFISNTREDQQDPLDIAGFITSALGSSLTMLGLALLGSHLVPLSWAIAMTLIGVVILVWYFRGAAHVSRPLLDPRFLQIPTFRASVLGGSLFRIGLGSVPFLLPLALQEGMGMSAFHSGMITCASAFGALFMKSIGPRVLKRYGFRNVLMINALLAGLALASFGLFTSAMPVWLILAIVVLGGFFPSLQFTCLNSIVYADIRSEDAGRATSLASVVQQLSLGLGVIIAGMTLQLSNHLQGHAHIAESDFWPAFVVVGFFSILSIPVTRRLPHDAGAEMAQRG